MDIIKSLKNITSKKEFKSQLIDLIFKQAKNKEDSKTVPFVQISNSINFIEYGNFAYCSSLKYITIPNSVTSIGYRAFAGCNSLTSITIPNSVTSIGLWAFANCTSLTSITIPNFVTSIGKCAFTGCNSLTYISIPKKFEKYMNKIFKYVDLSEIEITYIRKTY